MNKKFIKVSISIFLFSFIFILGFNFILGNKILFVNSTEEAFNSDGPIIKYSGFEEGEDTYKIKVKIKNNSDYYANFNDISLSFYGGSNGSPVFKGYDDGYRKALMNYKPGDEYVFSPYFEADEEREYSFEVSKGLSFDKEYFDINKININYNVSFFRYRINNNTVIGNVFSKGGAARLDNSTDPFNL